MKKKSFMKSKRFATYVKKNFVLIKWKNGKNKVGDHCHYTGKLRGATHSVCNLRYKVPKVIVAHNAAYDSHFIIKQKSLKVILIT